MVPGARCLVPCARCPGLGAIIITAMTNINAPRTHLLGFLPRCNMYVYVRIIMMYLSCIVVYLYLYLCVYLVCILIFIKTLLISLVAHG